MSSPHPLGRTPRLATLALAICTLTTSASAQVFDAPDTDFRGSVRPATPLVVAGSEVEFVGRDFTPGQQVTLLRGDTALNPEPYVADAEGGFSATITLPEDAVPGRHPLVLRAANPSAARIVDLKISPQIPLSGEERFEVTEAALPEGLYQTAYSADSDTLFVTSAVGRPPVTESALLKVDPHSLEVLDQATPEQVPGYDDARVFAVYGIGVDDANGNVWVTNTREDTIAVYRQADLSLVKQFDIGTVPHSRDVIIDSQRGKAYVSATGENHIAVFDAASLEFITHIEIDSQRRGERFVPMSLELDAATGRLFTVSIATPEAVVIDTENDVVEQVIGLSNAHSASGVAYDAESERLLVASQGTDNLLYIDLESGEIVHDVAVGAGALNVAFDAASGLAYVSNRASSTVSVLDREGQIVATLDGGTYPNHVHEDGRGNVFAVNKSHGADDPRGDHIRRIEPAIP